MKYKDLIETKLSQGYYFKEVKAERKGKRYTFYELLKKVGEGTHNVVCLVGENVPSLFYAPVIESAKKLSIVNSDYHIPQKMNVVTFC